MAPVSQKLYDLIHKQRAPLYRGAREAELRAVALTTCDQIVAATGNVFPSMNFGYFLKKET